MFETSHTACIEGSVGLNKKTAGIVFLLFMLFFTLKAGAVEISQNTENYPPEILSEDEFIINEGVDGRFYVDADAEPPASYRMIGAPEGVSMNDETGEMTVLAGITPGRYEFLVVAENDYGSEEQAFILTIVPGDIAAGELFFQNGPVNNTAYVGESFTLLPNAMGGEWSWDESYFHAVISYPAQFTPIREGASAISYTLDGQSVRVQINIYERGRPADAEEDTSTRWSFIIYVALCVMPVAGLLVFFWRFLRRLRRRRY